MKTKVVDPHYAKSSDYRRVLKKIARKEHCPFCPKNFKYHQEPILKRIGSWFVTKNTWPYSNCRHHFVIIDTVHKESVEKLTARDFAAVLKLVQWTVKEFEIEGGGFAMRFGETSHTGATVVHLHCHLIVPLLDHKSQRAKTVLFPIG